MWSFAVKENYFYDRYKKLSLPTYNIRVYYDDTDATGYVYHPNYLKYMSQAREKYLAQKFSIDFFGKNQFFVLKNINLKYLKPSFRGDELQVSSLLYLKKSPKIRCCHEIKKNNVTILKADLDIVLVNNEGYPVKTNLMDYLV